MIDGKEVEHTVEVDYEKPILHGKRIDIISHEYNSEIIDLSDFFLVKKDSIQGKQLTENKIQGYLRDYFMIPRKWVEIELTYKEKPTNKFNEGYFHCLNNIVDKYSNYISFKTILTGAGLKYYDKRVIELQKTLQDSKSRIWLLNEVIEEEEKCAPINWIRIEKVTNQIYLEEKSNEKIEARLDELTKLKGEDKNE